MRANPRGTPRAVGVFPPGVPPLKRWLRQPPLKMRPCPAAKSDNAFEVRPGAAIDRQEARCRPFWSGGIGIFRSPPTPNYAWNNEA